MSYTESTSLEDAKGSSHCHILHPVSVVLPDFTDLNKVMSANLSLYFEVDVLEGCVCSCWDKGRKEKEEFLTTLFQ